MDYKDKIYNQYVSVQTQNISPTQNKRELVRQFPAFRKYYAVFLPSKDTKILDLACGNGDLVFWLNSQGFGKAQGIDISEEQVELAHSLGIANVTQADLREYLRDKPEQFDAVFALDILEHFSKSEILVALELIRASLRKGGVLILKVPNGESIFSGRYAFSDFTHETIFTERSLREILTVVGFQQPIFKETGPVVHGLVSAMRFCLWQVLRIFLNGYLLIETGQTARVLTQNIIAVAQK